MLRRIDRYLLKQELAAFAGTLLLVVTLLSIENAARMHELVSGTRSPGLLQFKVMAALVPEYLGIALPLASFIAPAWAIRALSLRGEWQMFKALGLGPLRMMRAPMLLALAAALLQLTVRMDLEPFGERSIDEISHEIRSGDYGIPLATGEFLSLDGTTTAYLGPMVKSGGVLTGVFVKRGSDVFSARRAEASRGGDGRIEVWLHGGQQLHREDDGRISVLRFDEYRLTFTPKEVVDARPDLESELDRLGASQLADRARAELAGAHHLPAFAALMARLSSALFCLMLPWFAFVLAVPPRRSPGGAALALGIVGIVLFLRTTTLVQQTFLRHPVPGAMLHMAIWGALTAGLFAFGARHDDGAIDAALARALARLRRLLPDAAPPAAP